METLDPAAMERLWDLVGEDETFLTELMDTFLEDAPRLLADIRQAVEHRDAAGLYLAAHSLKSNSTDFGAIVLSSLCRELEEMGKTNTLDKAAETAARAEVEYEQVKTALEAARRELSSQDEEA
jgi:HPt (histidine-containing phosphotransfer) domain-containing protein